LIVIPRVTVSLIPILRVRVSFGVGEGLFSDTLTLSYEIATMI
jgi:hypothetical protein